ncbi:MAG: cellulase family glycosylhydrolase [Anaerolineales bacterium]|nr:cellulase family glycosylhydrolase [Anaerolineales bacterium]
MNSWLQAQKQTVKKHIQVVRNNPTHILQSLYRILPFVILLWILLSLIKPAPILITPGPHQSVQTNYPALGVHTRLTDEVEEWKIQHSLQLVREMGAPWIVEFFPWAYYHAEDGSIVWEHQDQVIEHAHAQGLTIIARIGLTPEWARPSDTTLTYLDANAYDDFATFAAAFAARYQGKVDYMIIGNEPNLSYEWGYRTTTPEDYVNLLKVVYPAVKAANPDMQILAGALAPTLEPAGSPWGLNDLTYLDAMYAAGAAAYFDGLAVHAYGLTFPATAAPDPTILNFRRIELVREVMEQHGDAETKIFVTETGWNDHPRWTFAVRPSQRIQYTLEALEYAQANWPYVEMLALWAFRFPAPTKSYMDYFTLVTPEFVNKPIFEELKRFTGN